MNLLPKSDTPQTIKKWASHTSTKIQFKELKPDYKTREDQHILHKKTDYQKPANLFLQNQFFVKSQSRLRVAAIQIDGNLEPTTKLEVKTQRSPPKKRLAVENAEKKWE